MSFADKARKILKEIKEDACEKSEGSEIRPLPFLDQYGDLVIPFGSDPRFHYWNGGQSIAETEKEVRIWLH